MNAIEKQDEAELRRVIPEVEDVVESPSKEKDILDSGNDGAVEAKRRPERTASFKDYLVRIYNIASQLLLTLMSRG